MHLDVVKHFYRALQDLESRIGGKRLLSECIGRLEWPRRGVYFFFEPTEIRRESGDGSRVTRVGTHAVSGGSGSTLWKRLSTHRGSLASGAGNHRGSVFRLLVGGALALQDPSLGSATWGVGSTAPKEVRDAEANLEAAVSRYMGRTSVIWLPIDDPPSAESMRGYIERNSIALLSNFGRERPIDAPSAEWLGQWSPIERVRQSGLWNRNHVDQFPSEEFVGLLAHLVSGIRGPSS
jgi:hypothetical protein